MLAACVLKEKTETLKDKLRQMRSVVVALSGGVDSAFLLCMAMDVLGDRAVAVTAATSVHPPEELERARCFARRIGARHVIIDAQPLRIREVALNDRQRCYFCKKALFSQIKDMAEEWGIAWVADGTNADDRHAYRPGLKALAELGIRSPLQEAGLTKEEIRILLRERGFAEWNLPSASCLLTRFPYGEEITEEKLARVGRAEAFLRALGFRLNRVRVYGDMARVEVDKEQMSLCVQRKTSDSILAEFKSLGFSRVTIDLEGYRSGSMDEGLEING